MAPLLRSRRCSQRLLVASATTSTRPYAPIDFRTTRKLHSQGSARRPLRASKQGKRALFLITIMLFDHFVAIYSHSNHHGYNRWPHNWCHHRSPAHTNHPNHGCTSHDKRHPRCWAGARSSHHANPSCWAGACSSANQFWNWSNHHPPNRARTTVLTRTNPPI